MPINISARVDTTLSSNVPQKSRGNNKTWLGKIKPIATHSSSSHKLTKAKPAAIVVPTAPNQAEKLEYNHIVAVKRELEIWLQNYIDTPTKNEKHTDYLEGYIKDEKIGKYIQLQHIDGKNKVKLNESINTPEKIEKLINRLLKDHRNSGSLYKELEKIMTPEHTLGKLFRITKTSGIISNITNKFGISDIKIEVRRAQKITPDAIAAATPIAAPEQKSAPTQAQIAALKADISIKYDTYSEFAQRDKLAQELLSFCVKNLNYSQLVIQEDKINPSLPEKDKILSCNDYDILLSNQKIIAQHSDHHERQYTSNMNELSHLPYEIKTPILSAPMIIQNAIKILQTPPPKSLWSRFIDYIFASQCAQQQEKSQDTKTKLVELQELVLQLESTKGFEQVGNASWLHHVVNRFLIKATPEKYHFKIFTRCFKLSSPERTLWKTNLKTWFAEKNT